MRWVGGSCEGGHGDGGDGGEGGGVVEVVVEEV